MRWEGRLAVGPPPVKGGRRALDRVDGERWRARGLAGSGSLLRSRSPARVVFHHSLDDALLRPHARQLQPLLEQLGWRGEEAIASPLLTRAIERAQRP